MLIENKGVIDNRERPDSMLFLCSFNDTLQARFEFYTTR